LRRKKTIPHKKKTNNEPTKRNIRPERTQPKPQTQKPDHVQRKRSAPKKERLGKGHQKDSYPNLGSRVEPHWGGGGGVGGARQSREKAKKKEKGGGGKNQGTHAWCGGIRGPRVAEIETLQKNRGIKEGTDQNGKKACQRSWENPRSCVSRGGVTDQGEYGKKKQGTYSWGKLAIE